MTKNTPKHLMATAEPLFVYSTSNIWKISS